MSGEFANFPAVRKPRRHRLFASTPPMSLPASLLAIVSLAIFPLVDLPANLRGPLTRFYPPIRHPPVAAVGLTVLSEQLLLHCEKPGSLRETCLITARYNVEAREQSSLTFDFIMSGSDIQIAAFINGREASAQRVKPERRAEDGPIVPDYDKLRRERTDSGFDRSDNPFRTFASRFRGTLRAGKNEIAVRYNRPFSYYETDYAGCYPFFSPESGRFVHFIDYELWPLREWTRAPDFHLDIRFSIPHKKPSWWAGLFSERKVLVCRGSDRENQGRTVALQGSTLQQNADRLEYRVSVGSDFPDRLSCATGDEDITL